ncbi:uncharacterized protein [Asterias amurensis]|uniref:uncharacterized protein n=1 Tax=Asterias amurensis TaxID=7602 RepID=UPI003AB1BC26
MVFSWTRVKPVYGSNIPWQLTTAGHHDVWRYLHDKTLLLGSYPEDQYIFEAENQVEQVPPFACSFSKMTANSHLLAVVDEDGFVTLIDTSQAAKVVKVFRAHRNAVFDVAWADGKNHLVTASGDQMAVLWDVVTGKALGVFMGHSCSLKSVCFRPGDSHVFATGARDGNILVWDTRCNNRGGSSVSHHTAVNIIKEAHAEVAKQRNTPTRKRSRLSPSVLVRGDSLSSVTVVNFQDDMSLFSAGATDSTIKVWDLRKYNKGMKRAPSPCLVYPYAGTSNKNGGFSSLVFNSTRSEFYASCMDDIIYRHSTLGLQTQPIATYSGHQNSSFYVKSALSRDDGLLLSGSGDGKAYIWNVHQPHCPPVTLCGHEDEVTMVTWAKDDFPKAVTGADDASVRIWRLLKVDDSTSSNGAPNRLIGHAEQSQLKIQMKENLPPTKSNEPPTRQGTPPPQTRVKSNEEEFRSASAPSSPVTPNPPQRRHSSISDWLKNSPKSSPRSPVTNSSQTLTKFVTLKPLSQMTHERTQEGTLERTVGPSVAQSTSRNRIVGARVAKQTIVKNDAKVTSGCGTKENSSRNENSSSPLNKDSSIREDHIPTEGAEVVSRKKAIILAEKSSNKSTVETHETAETSQEKQSGTSEPLQETDSHNEPHLKMSRKNQLYCQSSTLQHRTANSFTDQSLLKALSQEQSQFQVSAHKCKIERKQSVQTSSPVTSTLSIQDGGTSPRSSKRKVLELETNKVKKARTVGRGRDFLTSHAQHQLCTCSCSGNHRHPTGNVTASNITVSESDIVAGQTVGVSSSPEGTGFGKQTPKTTDCNNSTKNICFYFRPHTREVRRSYSDSSVLSKGSTVNSG